jgi:hypothetical protein
MHCLVELRAIASALGDAPEHVWLKREERTTLHVGAMATRMPSLRLYIDSPQAPHRALEAARQNGAEVYRYRDPRPGNETLRVVP